MNDIRVWSETHNKWIPTLKYEGKCIFQRNSGYTDIHNKPIYEGDIVEVCDHPDRIVNLHENDSPYRFNAEVIYNVKAGTKTGSFIPGFYLWSLSEDCKIYNFTEKLIIIGNVFDNADLL